MYYYQTEIETDEYKEFVDKFKPKKTTDDCYTPPNIYDVVADYVSERYGVAREQMIRPFYPGGDYETYDYRNTDVVVDNPPFSIVSQIAQFYEDNGIRFFIFVPALTPFSTMKAHTTIIAAAAGITYENGAEVNTSFCTNLEDPQIAIKSAPELRRRIEAANAENLKAIKKQVEKKKYPDNLLTAAMMNYIGIHGQELEIRRDEFVFVRRLDHDSKGIFGGGLLMTDAAAAKAVPLSEREKEIIKIISKKAPAE